MLLRALRDDADDAELARWVTERAFAALPGRGEPTGAAWSADRSARFLRRARHLARHDPGGCWLALGADAAPVGVVLSLRREGLWGLSMLAVVPGARGAGVGRALLERAVAYGAGALRGLISTDEDPRAVRMYRLAGFRLHPAMRLAGVVERSTLPATRWVREGGAADADFADAVDWLVRGAPHGPDHEVLAAGYPLLLAESDTGRGYCYLRPDGAPMLVAATDAPTARELVWDALARTAPGAHVSVDNVTAEQDWAVDVAVAAGLHVLNAEFLCTRGMRPPRPYIPSGSFL